jgi:hypothetical protein
MLDLRLPSGLFFSITGALLVVTGMTSPNDPNVNLYVGLVMSAFGWILLLLARRAKKT